MSDPTTPRLDALLAAQRIRDEFHGYRADEIERMPMTAYQRLRARAGQPVQKVEIPRTTCPRCGSEQYALPDGEPRPHLRPAIPGEELYSVLVPVRVGCE